MTRGDRDTLDAGQCSDAPLQIVVEALHLGPDRPPREVPWIPALRELILCLQDTCRGKARIYKLEPPEALDEESRSRHQHHRETQFRNHKRRAKTTVLPDYRDTSPRSRLASLQRRKRAEREGHDYRDERRHREHARVDADGRDARDVGGGKRQ